MYRRVLAFAGAIVCVAAFAACGSDEDGCEDYQYGIQIHRTRAECEAAKDEAQREEGSFGDSLDDWGDNVATVIGWSIALAAVGGVSAGFYHAGANIAARKGYSREMGWWAAIFWLLALVVLYLLPDLSASRTSREPPNRLGYCPSCGAPRLAAAQQHCADCGIALSEPLS